MLFYLGTDDPGWLPRVNVPLFVSWRRLARMTSLPKPALNRWALDSGGFTEVSTHGRFMSTAAEYVAAAERFAERLGEPDWIAPRDWMCEPWITDKTGLTVEEHQRRTVASVVELRSMTGLHVIPVLQGWTRDDYLQCRRMYESAGIDLETEPVVGLGSVCRRQATNEIAELVAELGADLRLHGFGVKTSGVRQYGWALHSADSMAWSYAGRFIKPCPHRERASCAHCIPHALEWRERVLSADYRAVQLPLC